MSLGASYFPTIRREPSLISYYRLNDLVGATEAQDYGARYNLNGFYNSSPVRGPALIQADQSAASFTFGSAGVNISVDDVAPLRITGDISLEAWVVPYAQSLSAVIAGKMNSGGTVAAPYFLGLSNGQVQFALGNGATSVTVTGGVPPVSLPSHVVATSFRGFMIVYLDGVVTATGIIGSQAVSDGGQALYIGSVAGATGFNGRIGEVAIYNGALSARRVLRHFTIGQQILSDPAHMTMIDAPSYS